MGELVRFPVNGREGSGYLSVPESGSGPGVLVIQEWWGLVPHIEEVCDRFAAA
ncbi:MAG: dienelactone hydrolase family protein, partial [Actinomycetota bacterium]